MPKSTLAAVLVADEKLEMQEIPLPSIGNDDGLLRVESCGLCGTDVSVFRGRLASHYPYPFIPGHEVVGRIEKLGDQAAMRWNVKEGDLVAIEPLLHCGCCEPCLTGTTNICSNTWGGRPQCYGLIEKHVPPAVWGGYSQYMYLHKNTIMHKIPENITPNLAALFNPLGSGVNWAVTLPDLRLGDSILIIGPGQRGLSSVIAAREAGAGKILVAGRRTNHRLNLAKAFGAITIDLENENLLQRVREETAGRLMDVVMDTTPTATQPILDAMDAVRPGGTIILAGEKGHGVNVAIPADQIFWKELTIKGAFGADYVGYKQAIRIIASNKYPLEKMMTHSFSLSEAETAIRTLAGEISGQEPICLTINPWQ